MFPVPRVLQGSKATPRLVQIPPRAPRLRILPESVPAKQQSVRGIRSYFPTEPGSSRPPFPRRTEPSCAAGSAAQEPHRQPLGAGNRSRVQTRAPPCPAAPASRSASAALRPPTRIGSPRPRLAPTEYWALQCPAPAHLTATAQTRTRRTRPSSCPASLQP